MVDNPEQRSVDKTTRNATAAVRAFQYPVVRRLEGAWQPLQRGQSLVVRCKVAEVVQLTSDPPKPNQLLTKSMK